ncbi:MAG: DNA alkylation repair protein, partial [Ferrovibrionaceae bacterium]
LLAHLGHKAETDEATLFAHCRLLAHEKEFFIRKAIGWVLRDLGKRRPDAVRAFLAAHGDELSGLSRREATKWL